MKDTRQSLWMYCALGSLFLVTGCGDCGGALPDEGDDAGASTTQDAWVAPCSLDADCAVQNRACVDDTGVALCGACLGGFHDEVGHCVQDIACLESTCSGRGQCDAAAGVPICDCDEGYDGLNCETCDDGAGYHRSGDGVTCTLNLCDPNPCISENHEVCTTGNCSCDSANGWHFSSNGTTCTQDLCDPDPCHATTNTHCEGGNCEPDPCTCSTINTCCDGCYPFVSGTSCDCLVDQVPLLEGCVSLNLLLGEIIPRAIPMAGEPPFDLELSLSSPLPDGLVARWTVLGQSRSGESAKFVIDSEGLVPAVLEISHLEGGVISRNVLVESKERVLAGFATVGNEGGDIELLSTGYSSGVVVHVPQGAVILPTDLQIIEEPLASVPAEFTEGLPDAVWRFEPSGLVFDQPLLVDIPLEPRFTDLCDDASATISIGMISGSSALPEVVAHTLDCVAKKMTIELPHFSTVYVNPIHAECWLLPARRICRYNALPGLGLTKSVQDIENFYGLDALFEMVTPEVKNTIYSQKLRRLDSAIDGELTLEKHLRLIHFEYDVWRIVNDTSLTEEQRVYYAMKAMKKGLDNFEGLEFVQYLTDKALGSLLEGTDFGGALNPLWFVSKYVDFMVQAVKLIEERSRVVNYLGSGAAEDGYKACRDLGNLRWQGELEGELDTLLGSGPLNCIPGAGGWLPTTMTPGGGDSLAMYRTFEFIYQLSKNPSGKAEDWETVFAKNKELILKALAISPSPPQCGDGRKEIYEKCDSESMACVALLKNQAYQGSAPCKADCSGYDSSACRLKCTPSCADKLCRESDGCGGWCFSSDALCEMPGPTCVYSNLRVPTAAVCRGGSCDYTSYDVTCASGCDTASSSCIGEPCQNTCSQGQVECMELTGRVRACAQDSKECWKWSAYSDCPSGFCSSSTSCGSCPSNGCFFEGQGECDMTTGMKRTCEYGAGDCLVWTTESLCPGGACASSASCSNCTNDCIAGTKQCTNGKARTCQTDPTSGCTVWRPYFRCASDYCADNQVCEQCNNNCEIPGDKACSAGQLFTCTLSPHLCKNLSDPVACASGVCASPTACGVAPVILTFEASPAAPTFGTPTTVTWSWTYSDAPYPTPTCTIDNGVGTQTSGRTSSVTLSAPTTYTLTCSNGIGSAATRQLTLSGSCTHQCAQVGEACNADNVTLETCAADVNSCRIFSTQTCANGCLAGACLAPSAPVMASLLAMPAMVEPGEATAVSFAWAYCNSPFPQPTCTLDQGVGTIANGGSAIITVKEGMTLTLTCSNDVGVDSAQVFLNAGTANVSGLCRAEEWCWGNPLPQGNALRVVWGSHASDVWAAGQDGTMLRWDGASWSNIESGTTDYLHAMWGSSANDVWAIGTFTTTSGSYTWSYDNIYHWDGSSWTGSYGASNNYHYYGIWGSRADDVWAVGKLGDVLHWNGISWSGATTPTNGNSLRGVWGTSSNGIWAVGDSGVIVYWDGAVWTTVPSGTNADLVGVWGSDANDVWAVTMGSILHWDGTAWSSVAIGIEGTIIGIWGLGANDVWVVRATGTAIHWDGTSWKPALGPASGQLSSVWGSGSNDVWATGSYGVPLHWDGASWDSQSSQARTTLNAVWGSGPSDVWAVGDGGVALHWNGVSWLQVSSHVACNLLGIWGSSANDIWAVGYSCAIHWDGCSWAAVETGTSAYLRAVWGTGANDVWVVGNCGIRRWNGAMWSNVDTGFSCPYGGGWNGVWGRNADDVWITGDTGYTLHWDGTAWSKPSSGGGPFVGVWGIGATDVWVASGGISRWDGNSWSTVYAYQQGYSLKGVWGSSATDIWFVGAGGNIVRWNGTSFVAVDAGTNFALNGVWGASASDIWVVGAAGTILRYRP